MSDRPLSAEGHLSDRILRVAAYGVCHDDDRVLVARYVSPDGSLRHWALPGVGSSMPRTRTTRWCARSKRRPAIERVGRLLGVDARTRHVSWAGPDGASMHNIGVFYRVRVVGGELRHEVDGSTDFAAWIPIDKLRAQQRSVVVDVGLSLAAAEPPDGHVDPIPVEGSLRH